MIGFTGYSSVDANDFVSTKNSVDRFTIQRNPNATGAVFVGQAEDILQYQSISLTVRTEPLPGNVSGKSSLLYTEFGNDPNFLTMIRVFPLDWSDTGVNSNFFRLQTMGKYYRIRIVPSSDVGNGFASVQSIYHVAAAQERKYSNCNTYQDVFGSIIGNWDTCNGATQIAISLTIQSQFPLVNVGRCTIEFTTDYDGNSGTVSSINRALYPGQQILIYDVGGQYFRIKLSLPVSSFSMQVSYIYSSPESSSGGGDGALSKFTNIRYLLSALEINPILDEDLYSLSTTGNGAIVYQSGTVKLSIDSFAPSTCSVIGKRSIYMVAGSITEVIFQSRMTNVIPLDNAYIGVSVPQTIPDQVYGVGARGSVPGLLVGDSIVQQSSWLNTDPFPGFSFSSPQTYRIVFQGGTVGIIEYSVLSPDNGYIIVYRTNTSSSLTLLSTIIWRIYSDSGVITCYGGSINTFVKDDRVRYDYAIRSASTEAIISPLSNTQVLSVRNFASVSGILSVATKQVLSIEIGVEQLNINRSVKIYLQRGSDPLTTWSIISTNSPWEQSTNIISPVTVTGQNTVWSGSVVTGGSLSKDLTPYGIYLAPGDSISLIFYCKTQVNLLQASLTLS